MGRRSYQPPSATSIGTPEAQLWASVLHQAMLEGFFGCAGGQGATLSANSQAISFLVAERGEWADSRRRICGLLGIEDAIFTRMCRTVFEGGPVPQVPGFETRAKEGLDGQRELYREMKSRPAVEPTEPTQPDTTRRAPPKEAMPMENQTSPIDTNEDGLLYWPIKAPDTGTLVGWPLPNVGSKQWKVLRAATRKRGGNLQMFYRCGADWEKTLDEVTRRFDLEIVMIQDGLPVTEITGETHLFLRPRP